MSALTSVRDEIARAILGEPDDGTAGGAFTLGAVTLRAHQIDAMRRVRASIERVGGALLADEPGLGKTFVALALAREARSAIVVAPAALRAMWRAAMATAGVSAPFVSLEALSWRTSRLDGRCGAKAAAPTDVRNDTKATVRGGLVIVDEAHHVCNPATARYARLARLVSGRRVLLLSATPVRNRRTELAALLALFMGPRAHALDAASLAHCVVRREGDASLRPAIEGPHWHRVRAIPGLHEMIATIPPPLPALDGRAATALLTMSLARCWSSSLAALDGALRRRMQRGAALEALLDAGRRPTRHELRAWVVGDDAVQLAFPMLAVHEEPDAARLRAVLATHLDAVRALRACIRPHVDRDAGARARLLVELRRVHAGARIVAFSAHAATAEALYRALRRERGVALLTARGARTAGGLRPREDVLRALEGDDRCADTSGSGLTGARTPRRGRRPAASGCDEISLVIATDLLSEGVNLQGASVIVHLDVPWNPAGLDQRVGRAARMGSRHDMVHVHGFAPAAATERLLTLERRFRKKHEEQAAAACPPREVESLRAIVRSWRDDEPRNSPAPGQVVAHACASRDGFMAVVEVHGELLIVCGALDRKRRWRLSESPGDLRDMARAVSARGAEPDARFEARARAALMRWVAVRRARESAGGAVAPSRARRRLLARIDIAVSRAGARARATLASRIAHTHTLVDSAIGAGDELVLDELARNADSRASGLESLLSACEDRLTDGNARVAPCPGDALTAPGMCATSIARRGGQTVRALLLLLRHPS